MKTEAEGRAHLEQHFRDIEDYFAKGSKAPFECYGGVRAIGIWHAVNLLPAAERGPMWKVIHRARQGGRELTEDEARAYLDGYVKDVARYAKMTGGAAFLPSDGMRDRDVSNALEQLTESERMVWKERIGAARRTIVE